MFSSPHLKVEAGAGDVSKLSKPKRRNYQKNKFQPGSPPINTHVQTHSMKVWFQMGFRVCFFMSVWQILSSETASFTTDLQGLALDRRVRLSSSSSSMVSRQYGSLKPVQSAQEICSRLKSQNVVTCKMTLFHHSERARDYHTGRHNKNQRPHTFKISSEEPIDFKVLNADFKQV